MRDDRSDSLEGGHGPLVADVAGVQRRGRLEQQDVGLFLGDRPVLDPAGYDEELALLQPDLAIPEIHAESPLHHQEQLVLVLVMMPDELALELDQLDLLAVELAGDPRLPLLADLAELLREVHLLDGAHGVVSRCGRVRMRLHGPGVCRAAASARRATNAACSGAARPRSST